MSDKKITAFRFMIPMRNVALGLESYSEVLVFWFLCTAADSKTGLSYHSQYSIRKHVKLNRETIRKATQALVNLGLVTVESLGRHKTLRYTLNYTTLVEMAEAGKNT
jgi:predicted transcriptional regulator